MTPPAAPSLASLPPPTSRTGDIPDFTLGDRLRKAREHAGLSSQQLADKLALHRNTIGRYEANRGKPPDTRTLLSWHLLTGVDLRWLVTGDLPAPPPEPHQPDEAPTTRKRRSSPKGANSSWNTASTAGRRGAPSRRTAARMGNHPKGYVGLEAA